MADGAGKDVAAWAEESGLTAWADGAIKDVSTWAEESGLAEWARGTEAALSAWFKESGIEEWASQGVGEIQRFYEENRPAVEAWLTDAGEAVRNAWNLLLHPEGHTEQEIQQAQKTVTESLEQAAE